MDYKSIIEEQIRELQKVQDTNSKLPETIRAQEACKTAKTILELVMVARSI